MSFNDDLGSRMKNNYESIQKFRLTRRIPVIIRVDGKAFHNFTRNLKKPFDHVLMYSMQETMKYLCENIQNAVLGYTQSDEISILMVDYKKFNSSAWFDNEVQKICSISASIATAAFNKFFYRMSQSEIDTTDDEGYKNVLLKVQDREALFDSRCFNIPKEEVANYFYWRQLDATRNSIEMVGQAHFSPKQLHKKSCNDIQDMLHEKCDINWNDFSVPEKRGTGCYKKYFTLDGGTLRSEWVIDENIPIFKNEGREYIERWINQNEE